MGFPSFLCLSFMAMARLSFLDHQLAIKGNDLRLVERLALVYVSALGENLSVRRDFLCGL